MRIEFITSNKNKFGEMKEIVPDIDQVEIDLPEIQEMDAKKIIEAKLKEAYKYKKSEFIVEDTSLYIDALNGLPGPLAKWFDKTIGNIGLWKMVKIFGNFSARAKTIIGYGKSENETLYFEGEVRGTIVEPRGENGFGWDAIFLPDGVDRTFAQMSQEEKSLVSTRKIAGKKLAEYLGS